MRITNAMTTNRMLLNINKNMNIVNGLYTQLTSGKKIQMPSDNPIIASRALKFRTNISETNQYINNVKQGISWMEITEAALSNTTESLISIKELSTQGASDNYTVNNRQTFSTQLQSLLEQIQSEMNVTYAGRYVFSGYKTDTPPIVTKDNPTAEYNITQSMSSNDVENGKVYTKDPVTGDITVTTVNKLKLPYTGVTNLTELNLYNDAGAIIHTINLETLSNANSPTISGTDSAYNPADDQAYYIQDTGEIILGKDAIDIINANSGKRIDIEYTKTGLAKGDLNPEVYFKCTDVVNNKSFNMDAQNIQYEFGVNTRVSINNLAKDSLTASLYGDLRALLQLVNSVGPSTENELIAIYSSAPHNLSGADLDEMIKTKQTEESQKYEGVVQDAFNNMLGIIEKHSSQVSKEYTQLGSRMNRLELIQNRLTEDNLSYNTLMSDNENVDFLEATMNLNSANYVYQMALKAGGNIMQISLADYI